MLIIIAYMIIGAVLMYIVVDGKKLDSKLAGWYADYKEEMKEKPYGHYERGTFDKTMKSTIVLWFVLGWPTILFMFLVKVFKEKK